MGVANPEKVQQDFILLFRRVIGSARLFDEIILREGENGYLQSNSFPDPWQADAPNRSFSFWLLCFFNPEQAQLNRSTLGGHIGKVNDEMFGVLSPVPFHGRFSRMNEERAFQIGYTLRELGLLDERTLGFKLGPKPSIPPEMLNTIKIRSRQESGATALPACLTRRFGQVQVEILPRTPAVPSAMDSGTPVTIIIDGRHESVQNVILPEGQTPAELLDAVGQRVGRFKADLVGPNVVEEAVRGALRQRSIP